MQKVKNRSTIKNMLISTVFLLCAIGIFVNSCVAQRYDDFNNREPDRTQYCTDLEPEENLDIRRVTKFIKNRLSFFHPLHLLL